MIKSLLQLMDGYQTECVTGGWFIYTIYYKGAGGLNISLTT